MEKEEKPKYEFLTYNGRVKVKYNDYVMFSFCQLDFKGMYAYKDCVNLYGLDLYLVSCTGGGTCTMEIYFKSKETWLAVLKLLDENM
jgi:hypothetical protein